MHSEILNNRQRELLPLMALFRREYYLVGGTAIALYLGHRRSKWKDYVDLYFLLRNYFSIADITVCANRIFGELYSEKMFRSQLCYFDDIDYTEVVEWLVPNPPSDVEIKQTLTEVAIQGLAE